jgi:hypothetical protein
MSRHSWEEEPTHAWEAGRSSDSDSEEGYPVGEAAAEVLLELLLDLHYAARLSAKDLSLICFWADRAGAGPIIGKLGHHPDPATGHYQRHVDSALGCSTSIAGWHTVSVPSHSKHDAARTVVDIPVLIPYEELHDEMSASSFAREEVRRQVREQLLPPLFYNHEVRREQGALESDVGVGVFVDGVPTVRKDGVLGFWVINLCTRQRHLCAVLRKRSMCQCGCRGWCSVWSVLDFFRWALTAASSGRRPETFYMSKPWPAGSSAAAQAGENLCARFLMCLIKGDWMEWYTTFGFAHLATMSYPCSCCAVDQDDMYETDDLEFQQLPWGDVSNEDYDQACRMCEQWRVIRSRVQLKTLLGKLRYDKRSGGGRGRCLLHDAPAFDLLQGDRIEPCGQCPDIGEGIDTFIGPFPITLLFWRRSAETLVRHRNPLLSVPGATMIMLVIDTLHALLLGPAQRYCLKALWAVVEANVYGMDFPHQDTRDGSCIGLLRTELFDWYATQRTQFHNDVTQLDDLTPDMLGKRSERTLTIKGMECRWLIPFCVELVDRYRVHLPNDTYMALSASGHALVDLLERIDSGAVNPTHAEAKVIADGMHICFCYYLFPGIISGMRFPIILVLGQGVYLMCRFVGVSLLCIEVALLEARREAAIHSELCCFKTAAYELY